MKEEAYFRELAMPLLGKWSVFILLLLNDKEMYFAELERQLGRCSRKVLAQCLNDLLFVNVIYKRGLSSTGHKTYYGLSELGKDLMPLIFQVKSWIRENEDSLRGRKTEV